MQRYNPKEIEPKWQQKWAEDKTYHVDLQDTTKPKFYGFAMLPYPSGTGLHTGHVRTYTLADVTVRAKRQQGYNAYNPIGWDAFGLPAENYAIKTGTSPQETIQKATDRFREQLTRIGMSHDWSKEINTSDPQYYRWTQWVFTQLFERGLAYQKESPQWWCPVDQTVLANEQVEAGKCWRCGNQVEKKLLKQWFFKITDYADELLESAEALDWPNSIKTMQRNWIGRSQGAEIDFVINDANDSGEKLTVFTTRPDTLFGATFMVIAPEHPIVRTITTSENYEAVDAYIKQSQAKTDIQRQETDREKTGVFTGAYAVNPVNDEKIPIWIADYVLYGYGTGAIMAVPAHDERDFEFAQKFDIVITDVVAPSFVGEGRYAAKQDVETLDRRVVDAIIRNADDQYLLISENGDTHFVGGGIEGDETEIEALRREVTEECGYTDFASIELAASTMVSSGFRIPKNLNQRTEGRFFEVTLASNARVASEVEDGAHTMKWVSKAEVADLITWEGHALAWQQYLTGVKCYSGEGVMVHSGTYDGLSSSEAREKIVVDLESKGVARAVTNYKIRDWLISRQRYWGAPIPVVHCDKDGAVLVPEYQLPVELPIVEKYQPNGGHTSVLAGVDDWVNTVCPKCGGPAQRETDTMDGYACSSWYFLRYLDPHNDSQAWNPAVINRWMPIDFYNGADHAVSHLLYARFWTHFFHKIGLIDDPEPVKRLVYNAYILAPDGTKMSKSKGNVVDPLEIVDSGYGADALRVYEMFIAPYDLEAPWDTRGVPGCYRFLQRTWNLVQAYVDCPVNEDQNQSMETDISKNELLRVAHKTVKKVTGDIEATKFNTSVAAMMEAVNGYMKLKETYPMSRSPEWHYAVESLVMMIAPFAPHLADELWSQLGKTSSVHIDNWPKYDERYLFQDTSIVVVQINGKMRASLTVALEKPESEVVEDAMGNPNVAKYLEGRSIIKTVYVSGKIVNFVVK